VTILIGALAVVGAFVVVGVLVCVAVVGVAHLLTSEEDKEQDGVDLSWYVIAAMIGLLAGMAAAVSVAFSVV
jgi:hypothetical protein